MSEKDLTILLLTILCLLIFCIPILWDARKRKGRLKKIREDYEREMSELQERYGREMADILMGLEDDSK